MVENIYESSMKKMDRETDSEPISKAEWVETIEEAIKRHASMDEGELAKELRRIEKRVADLEQSHNIYYDLWYFV